jgi:hypothetical protein
MFIADMRYSRAKERKHHHKLVVGTIVSKCILQACTYYRIDPICWAVKNVTVTSILTNCKCLYFIIMCNDLVMRTKNYTSGDNLK